MRLLRFLASILLAFGCLACQPQDNASSPNEEREQRIVLVSGATGRQGGAVARELIGRGYHVRALTRNPASDRAQALAALGIELVKGDFEDRKSLDRALRGAHGAFSVQDFWEHDYEGEVRQGKNFADAAKAADIQHLVYSSVGSAGKKTGIPHFESKFEIEEHIRALGLDYTILRPVSFMEGWDREQILAGRLVHALDPEVPQQYIAVQDIGTFAAMAFEHPGGWLGRELDIAGDELTMTELAAIFSRVTGKTVTYEQVPWSELEPGWGAELTTMFRWFNDVGYSADIAALRAEHPGLKTVEQFLRDGGWAAD